MFDDIIGKKDNWIWVPVNATKRMLKAKWTLEVERDLREAYGIPKKHIGFCLAEYDEEICQDCYAQKSCLELDDL